MDYLKSIGLDMETILDAICDENSSRTWMKILKWVWPRSWLTPACFPLRMSSCLSSLTGISPQTNNIVLSRSAKCWTVLFT